MGWVAVAAGLLVYLPSLLVYFISPAQWWVMGTLGIGFPFIWMAFAGLIFLAFWLSRKTAMVLLLLWLLGLPIMQNVVGKQPQQPWQMQKDAKALRIMQWNCMEMMGNLKSDTTTILRQQIASMIRKYQPDIITLQDFQDQQSPWVYSNISFLRDSLGFQFTAYAPFVYNKYPWGTIAQGSAIFSKRPLLKQGFIAVPERPFPQKVLWADVVWENKPVRIISTHFESMNLNTRAYDVVNTPPHQRADTGIVNSGNAWKKLRFYQPLHVRHAQLLRNFMDTTRIPVVLGLDMNSVPSSYCYQLIKGPLQDAWLLKGRGWGSTYYKRLPHLRIDYLLTSPLWQVKQCTILKVPYSDHFPLVADLQWK